MSKNKANQSNKKFWSVKAEVTDSGESVGHLYLYGIVASESWWGDEVTPKQLINDIKALGNISVLNVHIFSDGGDVFAGTAIHSILKQQTATVNIYIEGIAASIATVIATAGDNVYISKSAMMMVHNAMFFMFGYYNAAELASMIGDLDQIREPIIAAYQSKTGKTRDEIIAIMDGADGSGTWFTADEAIEAGLADDYIPEESDTAMNAVACIAPDMYKWQGYTFDLSQYKNAPKLSIATNINMKARKTKTMAKSTQSKKPQAKKTMRTQAVKAELIEITCPECGATFNWDTAETQDSKSVAELIEVTCPECEATFQWDTVEEESDTQDNGAIAELIEVTCPECGTTFEWNTVEEEADTGDGASDKNTKSARSEYMRGIIAERQRIKAIEAIASAIGDNEAIYDAKYKNICTAKTLAFRAMRKQASLGTQHLENVNKDFAASGAANVSGKPNGGTAGSKATEAEEVTQVVNIYNQMRNGGKKQ